MGIAPVGRLLRNVRPGPAKLATARMTAPRNIVLSSSAFSDNGALPTRFTADGEGLSPPLTWSQPPACAASLVLLIEDIDAPFPKPLVHAIVYDLQPDLDGVNEGAIPPRLPEASRQGFRCGRNSRAAPGWMPPSPIPAHGTHRYVFQLLALTRPPSFQHRPGRGLLLRTIANTVCDVGLLTGTYERD